MDLSTIHYFLREKFYGQTLAEISQILNKNLDGDGYLIILKSYCLCKLGRPSEAIRLLKQIDEKYPELKLAIQHALRIAYLSERNTDTESVKAIESSIQKLIGKSSDVGYHAAAWLLILEDNLERARSLAIQIPQNSPENQSNSLVLRGWIEIMSNRDTKNAVELFDKALEVYKSGDAYLGKTKIFEVRRNILEMKSALSIMLSDHPSSLPAHIELIKAAAIRRDWPELSELAQKADLIQSNCIQPQIYELLHAITVGDELSALQSIVAKLDETVVAVESTNCFINSKLCSFFMSITIDNKFLLDCATQYLDRCLEIEPRNSDFILKKSRLAYLGNNVCRALQLATSATEFDDGPKPFLHLIHYNLKLDNIKEAKNQFDFLSATHKSVQNYAFFYLRAMISSSEGKLDDSFYENIQHCIDLHLATVQNMTFGIDFIEEIDFTFLIEIAKFLIDTTIQKGLADRTERLLKEAERVLVLVHENCLAFSLPIYLFARVKFLTKDFGAAESMLGQCIERDNRRAEAYLLLAQTYLQSENIVEASKVLDMGLSYNFKVREHPVYYITKSKLEKKEGHVEMAVDLLQSAIQMSGWSDTPSENSTDLEATDADRIAIYLELIDCLRRLDKIKEADSYMNEVTKLYSGRSDLQEQLVLINADLQIKRGNVDEALSALMTVRPDEHSYQDALIKMAEIYIEQKHDKHKYVLCYRNILKNDSSTLSYELLGDAYMNIQEPTNAIEAYEAAMRRSPKDHRLAEKIANAYVKCHLYNKAIIFYEAAMKSGRQNILRIRFANQLFQMGNYEKCQKVLRDVLKESENATEISDMRDRIEYWMLLSKLHFEQNNWTEGVSNLREAHQIQLQIISRMNESDNFGVSSITKEKHKAARICYQLGEMHSSRKEYKKAIEYYNDAISLDQKNVKSMLACATIYKNKSMAQQCNKQCQSILTIDPNNIDASLLLADLMYQQNKGDEAIKRFAAILDRNRNHYHALARYVELVWRRGNIDLIEIALKKAAEANPRTIVDAGYNYCKGLAEWYTGEPNNALQAFNRARRDLEWGERALYNMIEICLNPENKIIDGDEDAAGTETDDNMVGPLRNNVVERDFGLRSAERFFRELRLKSAAEHKYKITENFIASYSSNKADVQNALANFLDMCRVENEDGSVNLNVAAIMGSARCYIVLKQTQKAKAQLKLILNYQWNLEEANYLEQCLLLLADIYINQNKNEQATSTLQTVLQHNASCTKAYEYMGFLCERDLNHSDAASNYEMAFKLCKYRNPAIGYKLAYTCLKCRRFFECIEFCHIVLKQYPNYPKIKKDLLDKARANIRI